MAARRRPKKPRALLVCREGDYDDDTKADLGWMSDAIDRKPKIVDTAIVNSDIRSHTTKRPFLTVQELTKRIMELAI